MILQYGFYFNLTALAEKVTKKYWQIDLLYYIIHTKENINGRVDFSALSASWTGSCR
jgi:hypothetical protein